MHVSAMAAVLSQQWQPGSLPGLSAGLLPYRTAAFVLYRFKTDKSTQQEEQSAVSWHFPDTKMSILIMRLLKSAAIWRRETEEQHDLINWISWLEKEKRDFLSSKKRSSTVVGLKTRPLICIWGKKFNLDCGLCSYWLRDAAGARQ